MSKKASVRIRFLFLSPFLLRPTFSLVPTFSPHALQPGVRVVLRFVFDDVQRVGNHGHLERVGDLLHVLSQVVPSKQPGSVHGNLCVLEKMEEGTYVRILSLMHLHLPLLQICTLRYNLISYEDTRRN